MGEAGTLYVLLHSSAFFPPSLLRPSPLPLPSLPPLSLPSPPSLPPIHSSEFLQRGSTSEVNVSANVQELVEKDIQNPSRYAFTAAQVFIPVYHCILTHNQLS